MRPLTVQLEQFRALESIAKQNGLPGAENLVSQQIERLIASYYGPGVSSALREHIRASIAENRHLLERLAQ
jgi:predicted Fe-Mo cluster-binding NifX family protein